ncbi:Hsp33 family molecular chaperone HslO [Miniphocaeibacter massiliensis]|uniref:Hsp33 family molecular chaperone HslO n=1 Tax=Miniphocaeibacter massiliensis TaxID=2041841 RepID=UPI000C08AE59|nr:Hsp33 family molecular chaperone HslO [Miniphocaeibacter massiliensis]
MSKLYRAINKNETIRFLIINSTEIVEKMRITHNTSSTATAALGRLTTMSALLKADIKGEKEKVISKIDGGGPAGLLISEVNNKGDIRSYIQNPEIDIPSINNTKLNVGVYVGKNGSLAVIRDFGFGKPYGGYTNLVSGEIAEDFANYFYQSAQLPTVVNLGVLVDKDFSVKSAGGLFIQALPGYTDEDIDVLEECINNLPPISSIFSEYNSVEEIFNNFFKKMEIQILGEEEVKYKCSCNRENIERALISIGEDEIKKILEEDHHIELSCSYCNKKYDFSEEEVNKILKETKAS